jgi:hypothetical protein
MRRPLRLLVMILAAELHVDRVDAQATRASGTIDGVVSDTSLVRLGRVDVSIMGTSIHVVTGENGRFRIHSVPSGNYLLVAKHLGFHPVARLVGVIEGDTLRISILMETAAQSLDSVVVTGESRSLRMIDFDHRRATEQGQFMTAEQIDKRNSIAATELLRTFIAVSVKEYPGGGGQMQYFAMGSRGGITMTKPVGAKGQTISGCFMKIFVDGVAMPSPLNLEMLPSPKDLAGIEVYSGPATTPLQFTGAETACGVILVWTKDGS